MSVKIVNNETLLAFNELAVAVFKLLIVVARSAELTLVSSRALIPIIELLTSTELAFKFNRVFTLFISDVNSSSKSDILAFIVLINAFISLNCVWVGSTFNKFTELEDIIYNKI